jgi:putative addiction module component (TIGR02574 family)
MLDILWSQEMEQDKIASEIKKLSLSQKLILTQDIWDSIALERGNLPMPDWQKRELERRYSQYKEGNLALHDWREVHEGLREKYR